MPARLLRDRRRQCREYYHRNRVDQAGKALLRKNKRIAAARGFVLERKKSGCVDCGEKHPATLDFDHRDKSMKRLDIAKAVHSGYGLDTIKAEIEKCDVRCSNCHRKKTFVGAWFDRIK